ncbi:MAG: hypothetical protein RL701_2682 [Pseudomonadota bacterium]|jgi:cell division protein FtsQ
MARRSRTLQQPVLPTRSGAQNRRRPRAEPQVSFRVRATQWFRRLGLERLGRRLGRDDVQRAGLRIATVVSAVALGFAVIALIERHLHTSSSFAIDQIDITGNQQLTPAQVTKAAGLAIGQNVFATAPEEARRRLLQEPWIESATVRRRLPGRYTIEVRERRAVALMAAGELNLVSDEGLLFKPLEPNDPVDLPVITGLDPNLHTQDEQAQSSALLSAVALLHDYQDAGLLRRETISEIHVESDGSLSLYLGLDATYVRLGRPPFRQKLERLREVMTRLGQDRARAAYVYLDNQRRLDRVTARLR